MNLPEKFNQSVTAKGATNADSDAGVRTIALPILLKTRTDALMKPRFPVNLSSMSIEDIKGV
jgi:hypothetical protein